VQRFRCSMAVLEPVALLLIERQVPMVFHTGVGIPPELAAGNPDLVVCIKPTSPDRLVRHLRRQMNEPKASDA